MALFVQTPTGTKLMDISELLRDDLNLNEINSEGFIDPMSVRIPSSSRDVTDDFDLPDIEEIEEIDPETYKKSKGKK